MNNFEYKIETEKTIQMLKERVAELERINQFWQLLEANAKDRIAELEKLYNKVWIGTELFNEGYDATITTKIELFLSEESAQKWVSEIKSHPDYKPNYFWRECEEKQIYTRK